MIHSDNVISEPSQVDAAWLTRALTAAGALRDGAVADVAMQIEVRSLSTIARLQLAYTAGAQGVRPQRLFLKICTPGAGNELLGPSEVHYYTRDYAGVRGVPLLTYYDAAYSAEQGSYHLLLDDVSATHAESHGRTPTLAYGLALAEGLARMHVHWWGPGHLEAGGEAIPGAAEIERYVAMARAGLAPMLQGVRGEITTTWRAALHDLFTYHPAEMIARTANTHGFTLVHGDVNPGNILAPVLGDAPVYIIDRQPFDWSLTTWLGVSDLAYMMVHWWDSDIRRELETPILRHYHQLLCAAGVRHYSWQQLLLDYRLCVVQSVYVATEWCRNEADCVDMKWAWFPMLQKAMTAYFDHDCASLW